MFTRQEALDYHSKIRPGKMEVIPIKPCRDQRDLSMAYSPGVAEACLAIKEDKELSFTYTGRGNLVAVVSNGTAVLGLGNIGPEAGKPVMEGKSALFKTFADIDCYDIDLAVTDPEELCQIIKALEPTFGGINLEDIKAPECFYIEKHLDKAMNIPVFHDDQHGTAIISGAGLINAMDISGKRAEDIKVVVSGAGAAGIACARFYTLLGVQHENIAMFDSRGHIHQGRSDLSVQKKEFAQKKAWANMAEAFKGADMFLGLSMPGTVTQDMVRSMNKNPVIFACANPTPEIPYPDAKAARLDLIMGTGRSDFPNQVNNVAGFPYIFRGSLDVRAVEVNEDMKLSAARALAALAREPVPDDVLAAYDAKALTYGPDYIIPKPFDHRLIEYVAGAVAESAMRTGVARRTVDMSTYRDSLRERMVASRNRMENIMRCYGW
ncbi:malate dehydrogenase [Desulfosarcina sp. OttesenSCG-928-A07]|nr:malate dehydrogenase [Desulfosarcina sp. OttesenSCG-928-G17]MDL2329963.1 malate dehydrogenase [Desulfosarcina sp. OttesenSCG-928-A07]